MAYQSAWGRWIAADRLAASKLPMSDALLMDAAAHLVTDQIINGKLVPPPDLNPGGLKTAIETALKK